MTTGRDGKGTEVRPTQNGALDLLSHSEVTQELAGLESKRLVAVLAQARGSDIGEREGPLQGGIVGTCEDQGVTAEHRFDVCKEVLRHLEGSVAIKGGEETKRTNDAVRGLSGTYTRSVFECRR